MGLGLVKLIIDYIRLGLIYSTAMLVFLTSPFF